ncbi:LysR substrate-binding domain-containing protein [Microvirga sp. W0021]|uniref:LysR substrate-binding domain-containing protein n=1 Tax=Hohaiivirga grylli TaxID=3133970 RepID=A0ABV0BI14_9HYPH
MKASVFVEENMKTFSTVARLASFSEAADELGLTTSGVSYIIKRLEESLGIKLFHRSTRKVELTEAGKYFHAKVQALLEEFRSIEEGMISIDKGVEAKLTICVNNLLHTPYHTTMLTKYIKNRFPSCQLRITTEVYGGVWDAISNQGIDVAIGAPGILIDGGGINYKELSSIHWQFAVAPHHPVAKLQEPIPDSQLRQYPAICVDDTASQMIKKIGWLLYGQEAIFVPDMDTKLYAQQAGSGIGFLPDYLVRDSLADGKLVTKTLQNPRQPSLMLLAWKSSLKGRVTEWIRDAFEPGEVLSKLYSDLMH